MRSMSRRGNHYDSAVAESASSTMTGERLPSRFVTLVIPSYCVASQLKNL